MDEWDIEEVVLSRTERHSVSRLQSPTESRCSPAICMMFAAASVQIAVAQALQQSYPRIQIAHKPLTTNALLSPSGAWPSCAFRCSDCIMKTHAIYWKSSVSGQIGTGKKLFEQKE